MRKSHTFPLIWQLPDQKLIQRDHRYKKMKEIQKLRRPMIAPLLNNR